MIKKWVVFSLSCILYFALSACSGVISSTTATTGVDTEVTTTSSCKASNMSYLYDDLDYQLVFYDEFDKETGTLSTLKWKYQTGDGGWGNNELQYYTDGANSLINQGKLLITARLEAMGDSLYTSARINSVRSFLYGKFEISAKLPQGSGTWPALWLMPERSVYGGWPNSGEIDIMEHVGTDMNRIHFSVHTERYYFKNGTQKTFVTTIPSVASEYHTYGLEWLPDQLIFSVDDVVYFTYDPKDYVSCPDSSEWPFDKSFYLIMNVAIGGWGGTPYSGFESESMSIDYVRVYQATNLFP